MIENKVAYCVKDSKQLFDVLSMILDQKQLDNNQIRVNKLIQSKFNSTDSLVNEIL